MNTARLISAALPCAALSSAALAQPFAIEWHTIDCGGTIATTAGNYTLSGSTGQPDAGTLAAGAFHCQGGFWHTDIPAPPVCYPNCDGSTGSPSLTANDFQCFLNQYAAQSPYANCDNSTGSPSLTANDFQCFLNSYAAGCP